MKFQLPSSPHFGFRTFQHLRQPRCFCTPFITDWLWSLNFIQPPNSNGYRVIFSARQRNLIASLTVYQIVACNGWMGGLCKMRGGVVRWEGELQRKLSQSVSDSWGTGCAKTKKSQTLNLSKLLQSVSDRLSIDFLLWVFIIGCSLKQTKKEPLYLNNKIIEDMDLVKVTV